MASRIVTLLVVLFVAGGLLLGQAPGQDQPPPAKKTFKRGRVAPKDLAALRKASVHRYGAVLKKLPKITAPSFDCRTLGLVPPIVNQGQCGSCWDFSGTGMCTSALIKAGYGKADGSFMLSEQYTLDCGKNGGCDGDDNTTVMAWAQATGIPTTADYGPYTASPGPCRFTAAMKLYKIADWGFCTTSDTQGVATTQDIKNAMVAYGPIGAAVAAGPDWDAATATTTLTGNSTDINHDIILVGWDDDHVNGEGTKGAWIVRNSWGTEWANNGYCFVKYGADSIGTEAIWCTATPIVPPAAAPAITSATTASGVVGTPFTFQVTASNTPTSFAATGLPDGLAINATSGAITGTPTAAGTSSVSLSATNANGTGTATLTLTVTTTTPVTGVTITLTADQVNSIVSQSGAVVLRGDMTLNDLMAAWQKGATKPDPKSARQERWNGPDKWVSDDGGKTWTKAKP
jgi:cathepsin L